jgi:hypothetical protein
MMLLLIQQFRFLSGELAITVLGRQPQERILSANCLFSSVVFACRALS